MAVFVAFPDVKGVGDTFAEAEADAYEQLEIYLKKEEQKMNTTFEAGVSAYETKAYDKAYNLFVDSAEHENADAMVNLGIMAMQGKGCPRNIEAAKQWFGKAAERGSMHAMMSLAQIHEKGLDGAPDAAKSLGFYKDAADHGHIDAQLKTGMLFRERGKNAEAMRYLITAAHNNNPQAQEIVTYVSNKSLTAVQNTPFRTLNEVQQRSLVEKMIDEKIRPTLAADGGGIELVNYIPGETPQAWLLYLGACSGCHLGSTSTADMLLDRFEELIDKNVVLYLM